MCVPYDGSEASTALVRSIAAFWSYCNCTCRTISEIAKLIHSTLGVRGDPSPHVYASRTLSNELNLDPFHLADKTIGAQPLISAWDTRTHERSAQLGSTMLQACPYIPLWLLSTAVLYGDTLHRLQQLDLNKTASRQSLHVYIGVCVLDYPLTSVS